MNINEVQSVLHDIIKNSHDIIYFLSTVRVKCPIEKRPKITYTHRPLLFAEKEKTHSHKHI